MIEVNPFSQVSLLLSSEPKDICGVVSAAFRVPSQPVPSALPLLSALVLSHSVTLHAQSQSWYLTVKPPRLCTGQLVDKEGKSELK